MPDLLAQSFPRGQQPVSKKNIVAPTAMGIDADSHYSRVLVNPQVRAYRVSLGPHESTQRFLHSYDYLVVAIERSEIEAVGEVNRFTLEMRHGEVRVLTGGWVHKLVNLSSQPASLLVLELVRGIAPQESFCGLAVEACHETHFGKTDDGQYNQTMLFETAKVRLLRADLSPGATLPEHTDRADHLIVILSQARFVEGLDQSAGSAIWNRGRLETVKNLGDKDAQFLILEIK